MRLRQTTDYPWAGAIRISVEPERPTEFTIRLRIPGWCRQASLAVNGEDVPVVVERGYVRLDRRWRVGDAIDLSLAMPVERIHASSLVKADAGRVALQRGPIVYCLEEADNEPGLNALVLPRDARIDAELDPELLGGVVTLTADALRAVAPGGSGPLYSAEPAPLVAALLTAVPYCVWENREPGEMLVWVREY